jgi:hypothetical protein
LLFPVADTVGEFESVLVHDVHQVSGFPLPAFAGTGSAGMTTVFDGCRHCRQIGVHSISPTISVAAKG